MAFIEPLRTLEGLDALSASVAGLVALVKGHQETPLSGLLRGGDYREER